MSQVGNVSVSINDKGVLLSGLESKDWRCNYIDDNYLVLNSSVGTLNSSRNGFALFKQSALSAYLRGLILEKFSGQIRFYIPERQVEKNLFFRNGDLVFARSKLIDDRLGEVVYRLGLITLEEMMEAAVQVTKIKKFGTVLIENQKLSHADLWRALKSQIFGIYKSLFVYDQVYVSVDYDVVEPPSKVTFCESSITQLDKVMAYGQMVSQFINRITPETTATVLQPSGLGIASDSQDTFESDMLRMIQSTPKISEMLEKSKLAPLTTLQSIFQLASKQIIDVVGLRSVQSSEHSSASARDLKTQLDTFNVLLVSSRKAFDASGVLFPVDDLKDFVRDNVGNQIIPLYLADDGSIATECVRSLFAACRHYNTCQAEAMQVLESLIQFLLQLTTDSLADQGKALKRTFDEMRVQ